MQYDIPIKVKITYLDLGGQVLAKILDLNTAYDLQFLLQNNQISLAQFLKMERIMEADFVDDQTIQVVS